MRLLHHNDITNTKINTAAPWNHSWSSILKSLHHNDITSAKVNTAAPFSHQGPLEHNLEPDKHYKGANVYQMSHKLLFLILPAELQPVGWP